MSQTRRLAAILAADVAGYSRLMGADEEGTLERLKALRRELVDPKIAEHHGRIVKTTGDGLLVEFASVVDAVRCAVAVQQALPERNTGVGAVNRIELRIGINLGDVIVEGDDLYGDGVNIAARIEALADAGGVFVSNTVHDQVCDRLPFVFEDLGEQQVKNIARPVRVFRTQLGASKAVAETPPALALSDKPSLAVLPFQNITGDVEQEYFVDGMVEEITTAISRLPWLFVIARNSSFAYKRKSIDVKRVAQELGVRYVLEGSVRKAGQRVRITGQLIDAAAGNHIWADRFDGSLDDIFDLQDRVAASVVGAIEPRLRLSEIERASRKPTANLGAYDLYLRTLAQMYRYTEQSFDEAIVLARRALAIDPLYASAAAIIGWCRTLQRVQGWGAPSEDDIAEGIRLARQALEAGRDDPDTIWQAAWTLFILAGEAALSETFIDRALTLNPNSAAAWQCRGSIYALRNNQAEAAIEAFERAQRLSPFDPLGYFNSIGLALAHLVAQRFEQAIEWADRTLHAQPRVATAIRVKIVAFAHLGRLEEARATRAQMLAIDPRFTVGAMQALGAPSFAPEFLDLYLTGLRLAGLPE
jgi:TolB-like protein/class 3 adenylate cyclase